MICVICGRLARGFGWFDPKGPRPYKFDRFCSMRCQDIWHEVHEKGIELNIDRYEAPAIEAGGERGGAYLESVGVTDMAELSIEQWNEFVSEIVRGYCDSLRAASEAALKPLAPIDTKKPLPDDEFKLMI